MTNWKELLWRDADIDAVMDAAYQSAERAEKAALELDSESSQSWSGVSLAFSALADQMRKQIRMDEEEDLRRG